MPPLTAAQTVGKPIQQRIKVVVLNDEHTLARVAEIVLEKIEREDYDEEDS